MRRASGVDEDPRALLGRKAEARVAAYLTQRGFSVIGRNVQLERLEIDIIARRADLLVFCEVRARAHDRLVAPAATIDRRKIARVRQAAARWLKLNRPGNVDIRFDAASVIYDCEEGRIEYYEGAF